MTRTQKLFLILLTAIIPQFAVAQFSISMSDTKLKPGEEADVYITMKNETKIQTYDFIVDLPTGFSFVFDDVSESFVFVDGIKLPQGQMLDANYDDGTGTNPNSIHALGFSMSAKGYFDPGENRFIKFRIKASSDVPIGSVSQIKMHEIVFNSPNIDVFEPDPIFCKVTVYQNYSISAASSSDVMGSASATPSGTVENGTSVTATATPIAGYEFVNWTAGDTEKSTANPYTFTAAEDVALVANFKAKKYNVTFDVDGVPTSSDMDFGSTITAPAAPAKTGYTFTGWEPAFVEGATVPVDGIKYTATWSVNKYTITFDTDGGTTIPAITQDYATTVTAPAAPTKTGYTFAGWDKEIPATIPAEDVTVKAQWTINQYTITFDTDGGTNIPAITQDYATAVTAPAAPTKTGYTFAGWDKEIPATIPAEDVTIKAQWTINQYTITFDTDGGTTIPAITQDYASTVTAPAAPTKTGYTFA